MAYYLQSLRPIDNDNSFYPIHSATNVLSIQNRSPPSSSVRLLLGGYSYGSLILARLPTMSSIVQRLECAEVGTAGAEILLRARAMAKQTENLFEVAQSPSSSRGRQLKPDNGTTSPTRRIGASPITVGGEETDQSTRRRSRDSRRSMDLVRKSVDLPRRVKTRMSRSATPIARPGDEKETPVRSPARGNDSLTITTRYLVISPVLLPFTQTLCPPGPPSWIPSFRKRTTEDAKAGVLFLDNPTLAIFGSTDVFTSSRRLRGWAQNMSSESKSAFEWAEIEGAGHFWNEAGVMQKMQETIFAWVKEGTG